MAEKLTPQQLQAVTDRGGRLLVSAAAGSGKTKVLVDRLMSYLTDPKDPADLDSFLIITYTKAAAAELRSKIGAKLSECIAESPENRHLQQQIQRLYLTKISTVHGFCSEILREFAYRLDIAADFRVADENECQELQMRALDRVLDNAYETISVDPDVRAFVDMQGLGRDDRQIPKIILKVYNSAKCHLDPEKWLSWCIDSVNVDYLNDAAQTVWGAYLTEDLHHYLDLNIAAFQKCIVRAAQSEGFEKPAALLQETVAQLTYLRECSTWDQITDRKQIDFGRLVFSKKCSDLQLIEQIKAIRNACKTGLEKKLLAFTDKSNIVLKDLQDSGLSARGLIALVRRFEEEYGKIKKARRVLDFADLEHKTLDLLLGKHRAGPTGVAAEIGSRFREIMVDEYQDSNGVQDAIFSALTGKRQNCFMVGDVKQSIYQFRLADPGIFIEKYNEYVPAETASVGQGRKVLLSNNFRSGSEVIHCVNDVFSCCMSAQVGGLDYGPEEKLYEGIAHIPLNTQAVELYGIQVQEDTYAEEAAFTADRITQLLDGNHFVRNGETLRPIEPDDIVILLRSPGSVGGEFRFALEQRGIRCTTGGSIDLLQTEEIGTLRAILEIINNPLQDIPLTAVLMSRVIGFSADDMAQLRGQNRNCSMYDALQKWERGRQFCTMLEKLRLDSRMMHIPQLLERIFILTRMDSIFSAMPDGSIRTANLQAFCQLASDYDSSGRRDLGQFLEHLDTMQERGLTVSGEKQAGCVTIMSIHKSKGLEFPVVFLCGLSRGFNQESAREQALCDRELGLGLNCIDANLRIRYPSVAKRAIAAKMQADSISEEMRVLYVAMTRARDRLIMTYAVKNLENDLQDIAARLDLSDKVLMTGQVDCPGSWILQTAMRRTEAGAFFALGGRPADVCYSEPNWLIQVVEADMDVSQAQETNIKEVGIDAETVSCLSRDLKFKYGHNAAVQTPSKQTATQLKGRFKDQEAAEFTMQPPARRFRQPSFVQTQRRSTDYGTAMHTVMQYISYNSCSNEASVRQQLQQLTERGLISQEQADMVDCQQIATLFNSEIGKKMREESNVLREFKFSILDDGAHYVSGMTGEQILLQGVVDCAILESDGITVIDFKTDYVTEDTISRLTEHYRPQVITYGEALERIYRLPLKQTLLYFFRMKRFVSIK